MLLTSLNDRLRAVEALQAWGSELEIAPTMGSQRCIPS